MNYNSDNKHITSGNYILKYNDLFKNNDQWDINNGGLDRLTNTCASYKSGNVSTDKNGCVITVGPTIDNSDEQCCGWDPGDGNVCNNNCILSGSMSSKYHQKYGIFIFSAKVPKGELLFPALWLVGHKGPWPATGEIDIMETIQTVDEYNKFSSRIMVPKWNDFNDENSANSHHWEAISLPPDGSPEDTYVIDDSSFWDFYHVWALDWYLSDDGDFKYDFYLDVKMVDGVLVNLSDGKKGIPYKKYSLKDMAKKYNIDAKWEKIRDAVKSHKLVMNIAASNRGKSGCGNRDCSSCNNIHDTMNVDNVQVWEKI